MVTLTRSPHNLLSSRSSRTASIIFLVFVILGLSFHRASRANVDGGHAAAYIPAGCPGHLAETDFSPLAIRCRIRSAQLIIRSGQKAQSSTPDEAAAEYRRRYRREPPEGFHDWVQFALAHQSKVIDDFDQIDRDLEPYRTAEAQRVFRGLLEFGSDLPHTTRIMIQNGTMSTTAGYMYGDGLKKFIEPFVQKLPDAVFFLSTIDEPRILSSSAPPPDAVQFLDRPGSPIEDLVLDSCSQLPRELTSRLGSDRDVCRFPHPADLHAFIQGPSTFSYTHSLVPMLSFGRMSAFRDILLPCPCYTRHPLVQEDPVPFTDKKPAVYWRGSSTGGRANRVTWRAGHRQRLVAFVQSLQEAAKVLDASRFFGSPSSRSYSKQIQTFKDAFDIQMGGYIQCDDNACKDMERVLGPANWEAEDATAHFRYLFDIDGNSMSTRFYRLLSRQAVVLKQTWFNEWHDDRLVPWGHYIPVTMGMEELPALISFLINDPSGEALSQEIAQAGSTWARETLREVDMSIYVYRLLLEMAELHRPRGPLGTEGEREAMGGAELRAQ